MEVQKQKIGKGFKKDAKPIQKYLEDIVEDEAMKRQHQDEMMATGEMIIKVGDQEFKLSGEFVKFESYEKKVMEEKYTPHVIEPSFGLGRIMYAVMEHSFKVRPNDVNRTYFDFPATIAPTKCSILPLMNKPVFENHIQTISKYIRFNFLESTLNKAGLPSKIDDSNGSVGKRYARTDEMGIPYAFTIDF